MVAVAGLTLFGVTPFGEVPVRECSMFTIRERLGFMNYAFMIGSNSGFTSRRMRMT